jgi:hypothetical protein
LFPEQPIATTKVMDAAQSAAALITVLKRSITIPSRFMNVAATVGAPVEGHRPKTCA